MTTGIFLTTLGSGASGSDTGKRADSSKKANFSWSKGYSWLLADSFTFWTVNSKTGIKTVIMPKLIRNILFSISGISEIFDQIFIIKSPYYGVLSCNPIFQGMSIGAF